MVVRIASASRAANGAEICGDLGRWWPDEPPQLIALADGIGHGALAAEAAQQAMQYIGLHPDQDLLPLFAGMNEALRSSRGAAVAVARLDLAAHRVRYAAVGNTRAAVFGWQTTRLDGFAGIVGAGYRSLRAVETPFHPGDLLVLWTDGVEELLEVPKPFAACPDPANIAEDLLARYLRGRDDACIIVARFETR